MATTPAAPRVATYSPLQIIGSLVCLLGVSGLLAFAATSVHDTAQREQAVTMTPGSISIVGAAKVLQWRSAGVSLQVPVGWRRIVDGVARESCAGTPASAGPCEVQHIWQAGAARGPAKAQQTTCDVGAVCVTLRSFLPSTAFTGETSTTAEAPTAGTPAQLHSVWTYALNNQRLAAISSAEPGGAPAPRFLDGGGVTVRGGRWATRVYSQVGDAVQTSYFFATCQPGFDGGGARVDHFWELRLLAPEGAVPTEQFDGIVGSLTTELPSPPRGGDCAATKHS